MDFAIPRSLESYARISLKIAESFGDNYVRIFRPLLKLAPDRGMNTQRYIRLFVFLRSRNMLPSDLIGRTI
jgi:hypothetical protein